MIVYFSDMDRLERREFVRKHRTCIFGYNRRKDVTSAKLPEIERMAREENRVVIRVRPYATFATPPRHVYQADDIDTLTHFTSNSQPW